MYEAQVYVNVKPRTKGLELSVCGNVVQEGVLVEYLGERITKSEENISSSRIQKAG